MTHERKTFTVQWTLFTEAENKLDAVRIALHELAHLTQNHNAGANAFTVFDESDPDDEGTKVIAAETHDDDVDVWAAFQKPKD